MKRVAALLVIFLAAPTLAFGQTSGSGAEGSQEPSTKALHGGILPLRDFGGDLSSRANLLGDWGGLRTDLAKKGIRFRGWLTPNVQRVADGGSQDDTYAPVGRNRTWIK